MKRELAAIAAITMAVCLLAACGVDTADVSLPPVSPTAQEESPEPTAAEPVQTPDSTADQTSANLSECFSLIGMDDARSAGVLGGGEQNIAADGETLIGRIYETELFGETVKPGTSYGADGKVTSVSIYLSDPDGEVYLEQLTGLYGEPTGESDGTSESGSTWLCWDMDGIRLTLYQSYGLCSLEITAVPQNG